MLEDHNYGLYSVQQSACFMTLHYTLGEAKGHHVVIVDDLVQTGGTLLECAKVQLMMTPTSSLTHTLCMYCVQVLQAAGAAAISVFVTHAVFPQESWRKFTAEQSEVSFANIWVTDSLPHARELANHPPFQVLSLCDVIADSLLGYDLLSRNV